MDKTLYTVSGFMRCGTSMMMRALEAGGLEAVYQQSRETMRKRYADEHYDPNVGGLYELEREDYLAPDFPRKYEGKLLKVLNRGVLKMRVMPAIRVVFMRRDPEEIRQSYDAFFNRQIGGTEMLDEKMNDIIEEIENRKDVKSLDVFWYRNVIKDPLKHFTTLREHGWPIKPDKSASIVDPDLCRYKKENLTIGVI